MKRTTANAKKNGRKLRFQFVDKVEQDVKAMPAPMKPLGRILEAAETDFGVAKLAVGLFEAICGLFERIRSELFPGYPGGLIDCRHFPAALRGDVQALVRWALLPCSHDVGAFWVGINRIKAAVHHMRRGSPLGRRFLQRARRLMRRHPPIPERKWDPSGMILDLMPEEIGKPLSGRVITKAKAFGAQELQIVSHGAYMNSVWTPGVFTIRLSEDGYSIKAITIAVKTPTQAGTGTQPSRVEGELIDFFETGTEGVIWMVEDDERYGHGALQNICEGDHLTILNKVGGVIWRGVIHCDKKIGWRRYPSNPKYGQQCALGHWVHWIQKEFQPDDWARFFIRPDHDRLRAILVRKTGAARDPRLGPDFKE
jgi:hypothetical protein